MRMSAWVGMSIAMITLSAAAAPKNYYWRDAGTDWLTAGNWYTNANPLQIPPTPPTAADMAYFPNDTVANQPTLSGAAAVNGLYFDNGTTDYDILGSGGTLTIGTNGIYTTRQDDSRRINADIVLNGNQTWRFGGNGGGPIRLWGRLGGTGSITKTLLDQARTVYFRNTNDTAFVGSLIAQSGDIRWELLRQTTPRTVSFGKAANGIDPSTITLGGGGFRFETSVTNSNPNLNITLNNPFTVTSGDSYLEALQSGPHANTNSHAVYSGAISLGGVLRLGGTTTGALEPTYSGNITLAQSIPLRLGLVGDGMVNYNSLELTGNITDGAGSARNPLILASAAVSTGTTRGYWIRGTANTYSRGTVIDYCSSLIHHDWRSGHVRVAAGASLGTGPVTILPGGRIKVDAAGGVNAAARVTLVENDCGLGVLALGYNGLPLIATNSVGVIAVDSATFDAITDMSTVGDGRMYLGSFYNGTFTGTTLLPGKDNLYRLGGGGWRPSVGISIGQLTINNTVLKDYGGSTSVVIGSPKWMGAGSVMLNSSNTFSGTLEVVGYPGFYNGPVTPGEAASYLQGVPQLTAGRSPFGNTNGTLIVRGSLVQLNGSTGTRYPVAKGLLQFEGMSRINVSRNGQDQLCALVFDLNGSSRMNRGVLRLTRTTGSALAINQRIVVRNGDPTETNLILPPYFYFTAGTGDFATYDETLNAGLEKGFTNLASTAYVAMPAPGGGLGTEVVSAPAGALPGGNGNRDIYALKATGALTGTGVLTIRSGGLILNGSVAQDINFGAAEGIILSRGGDTLSGKISGTGGLTAAKATENTNTLILDNVLNDFTGLVTLQGGAFGCRWDTAVHGSLGDADNDIYLNGAWLYRNAAGDRLLSSRTITLGTCGGAINGTSTNYPVYGQIIGTGTLWVPEGALTLDNQSLVTPNTYSGGTRVVRRNNAVLVARGDTKLGTGDLQIEPYASAVLEGNENLASGALATVAYLGRMDPRSAAPKLSGLSGAGDVRLGRQAGSATLYVGGDNSHSTFYGRIYQYANAFPGSLVKEGTGTFTLHGQHAYTGNTTVNGGRLVLMGSVASNLVVNATGMLGGNGGTIGGNLTVNASGKVVVSLRSDSDFDRLTVNRLVQLNGGTLEVNLENGYNPAYNTTWTIATSAGATGSFATVTPSAFQARLVGNNIVLAKPSAGTLITVK